MNLHRIIISFLFVITTFAASANAVDTTIADNLSLQKETLPVITKHNPRTATRRSAIIPGWGQAYNKEYWKIPIVYAALGTSIYFYKENDTLLYENNYINNKMRNLTILLFLGLINLEQFSCTDSSIIDIPSEDLNLMLD